MTNDHALITKLQFLKLGGSLITDKNTPRASRQGVIIRLAEEIKTAKEETADFKLVLGHGSGSFGHMPAKQYGTRQGVYSPEGWRGFAEVWYEAGLLNHLVTEALRNVGLSVVAFPPSAGVVARNGKPLNWEIGGLVAALDNGLLPVVFGDVIFDQIQGGTIFSTEDIFTFLAKQLHPGRILLAGIDAGVWADYPDCTQLISEITPESWPQVAPSLRGSAATDVTGGMASKVQGMLDLVEEIPGLEVLIFSGDQPGNVAAALRGETLGTRLTNNR